MNYTISWVQNNTPLFKIMPLKWLKVMIEEEQNTLLRPSTWNDPYEMNYSRSVIATQKGEEPLDASHWFGQCWSMCEESAIMWQAFKKGNAPYVKIKTTADSLISGLRQKEYEKNGGNLRLAVVEYIRYFEPNRADYEEKIKDAVSVHQWPDNFLKQGLSRVELYPMYTLLTKRNIFSHEEEVRLLVFDRSAKKKQKQLRYHFDPTSIEEIVLDPWTSLSDEKYEKLKKELRSMLPDEKTVIRKSEIFSDNNKYQIRFSTSI